MIMEPQEQNHGRFIPVTWDVEFNQIWRPCINGSLNEQKPYQPIEERKKAHNILNLQIFLFKGGEMEICKKQYNYVFKYIYYYIYVFYIDFYYNAVLFWQDTFLD